MMRFRGNKHLWFVLLCVASLANVVPCRAHFLWIKTVTVEDQPHALVFFNESPADESYHFPEKLAKTSLWLRATDGKRTEIAAKPIDTEERVGLIGPTDVKQAGVLETSQQYGVHGTALLQYHAKHIQGTSPEKINAAGTSKELKLEIVPQVNGGEVELAVLWEGKPLAEAAVTILVGDDDPVEEKSNEKGMVTWKLKEGGLIGVLANTLEKEKTGELDGKPYKGVLHYASLTFNPASGGGATGAPAEEKPQANARAKTEPSVSAITPLPEPVASFGAVVVDGWLYVYGGHTGEEHAHSAANLSKHFRRIRLDGGGAWDELPMQTPLQGLPLVARGGKVYRVGGLEIRNATADDEEDLHSSTEFAEYDPTTNKWTRLAPLPEARSSHNAAVIGDKLYVVGGWCLAGMSPGTWESDALVFDFTHPQAGWQKLPEPGFKRRALAAGVWKGKLLALGGMDDTNKVSMRVDVFDPAANKWEQGPSLPGVGMAGFGTSAWNLSGNLYLCGMRGILYRLNENGTDWDEAGRMGTPRFFHQLVPGPNGELLAVAGASNEGHLATSERLVIDGASRN